MKKIIRKILSLAIVAVMFVTGFACGKNEDNGKVTLLVDFHGWGPTLNTTPTLENPKVVNVPRIIAEEFTKKYPNITIKWVRNKNVSALEEEMSQWFTTQIETGVCPTIAFSWGTKFQYNDWYVDLTDYLNAPNPFVEGNQKWSDLYENYIFDQSNIRGIDGNIYAIPVFLFAGPSTGWYYNKEVMKSAGVDQAPKTWKEFKTAISKVKGSGFKGTAVAPWSYFNAVQLDQWAMLASLGPSFASYVFEDTDYNGDGIIQQAEQVRGVLEEIYNPVEKDYAKDLYFELKSYYTGDLENGWLTSDYFSSWEKGSVAMIEDGTWRMIDELNAKNRDFTTGLFPSPVISNDSYSYLPEIQYTEKGPYQPGIDFSLNIMKPAVEGKPEVLDAAVKFLQFLSQPEYMSLYAEEWGASLPATKGSTYSPLLDEWMGNSFPIIANASWPQAFVTEQNAKLNRLFAEWLNGRKTNAQFFSQVNEIQVAGAWEVVKTLGLNTEGWNVKVS